MNNTAFIESNHAARDRHRPGAWCTVVVALILTSCEKQPPSPDGDETESWNSVPIHFTNLEVLPETIERDELILHMRTISRALGVRCGHCHDMRTEDYAADSTEAKIMARAMMRLVRDYNALTSQRPDATAVTCYMCHRGQAKPPATDLPSIRDT